MSNFLAATIAAAGLILLLGQIGNDDYRTALAKSARLAPWSRRVTGRQRQQRATTARNDWQGASYE